MHHYKTQQVGERLALLALQDTYGVEGFDAHSPRLVSITVEGSSLILKPSSGKGDLSPIDVEHPVAVRYGFRNWSEASLFNNYGVPVGPFRSYDWDDIAK